MIKWEDQIIASRKGRVLPSIQQSYESHFKKGIFSILAYFVPNLPSLNNNSAILYAAKIVSGRRNSVK